MSAPLRSPASPKTSSMVYNLRHDTVLRMLPLLNPGIGDPECDKRRWSWYEIYKKPHVSLKIAPRNRFIARLLHIRIINDRSGLCIKISPGPSNFYRPRARLSCVPELRPRVFIIPIVIHDRVKLTALNTIRHTRGWNSQWRSALLPILPASRHQSYVT